MLPALMRPLQLMTLLQAQRDPAVQARMAGSKKIWEAYVLAKQQKAQAQALSGLLVAGGSLGVDVI